MSCRAFGSRTGGNRIPLNKGTLEARVWRIVLNEAKSAARRRRRGVREHADSASASPASSRLTEGTEVRKALSRLPERERLALLLRYFANIGYAEIADVLDVKQGTLGTTLSAGRANLSRLLREGARR